MFAGYVLFAAIAPGAVGALKLILTNDRPPSCVTLTLFTAMMWNGTSPPWIGSSTVSLSRSTASTGSAPRGTGTSAMDS